MQLYRNIQLIAGQSPPTQQEFDRLVALIGPGTLHNACIFETDCPPPAVLPFRQGSIAGTYLLAANSTGSSSEKWQQVQAILSQLLDCPATPLPSSPAATPDLTIVSRDKGPYFLERLSPVQQQLLSTNMFVSRLSIIRAAPYTETRLSAAILDYWHAVPLGQEKAQILFDEIQAGVFEPGHKPTQPWTQLQSQITECQRLVAENTLSSTASLSLKMPAILRGLLNTAEIRLLALARHDQRSHTLPCIRMLLLREFLLTTRQPSAKAAIVAAEFRDYLCRSFQAVPPPTFTIPELGAMLRRLGFESHRRAEGYMWQGLTDYDHVRQKVAAVSDIRETDFAAPARPLFIEF